MNIKIYRLKTRSCLHAFDDPILEVPVDGMLLADFQKKVVSSLGHELIDIESLDQVNPFAHFVYFHDDLVFTKEFLKSCLLHIKRATTSLQFALKENSFNRHFNLPHQKNEKHNLFFDFFYIDRSDKKICLCYIDQQIYEQRISIPRQIVQSGMLCYDQTDNFIMRLASPFHLLYANLALNLGRPIRIQRFCPQWIQEKFFSFGSSLFYRALKWSNQIGRNCKIHPSAIIEGAVIEDNVTIGAGSIIRLSRIGSDSTIEDGARVAYSVLGKKNYIAAGNLINLSMTYDEVFLIHGPYQFSIYGKQVAVMAVINCDVRLDQKNIKIMTDQGLLDSLQPLIGIAYGHGSVVGGGNVIAPGRIVPNDCKIPPPEQILVHRFEPFFQHSNSPHCDDRQ